MADEIASSFNIDINDSFVDAIEKDHYRNLSMEDSFEDTGILSFDVRISHDFNIDLSKYALGSRIKFFLYFSGVWIQSFAGDIIESQRNYSNEDGAYLKIIAYDISYRLKRKTNESYVFSKKKLEDNVIDIVKHHGVKYVTIHPTLRAPNLISTQSISYGKKSKDKTAWAALKRVADTYGLRLFVRDRTLFMVDDAYIESFHVNTFEFVFNEGNVDLPRIPIINIDIKNDIENKNAAVKSTLWTDKQLKDAAETESELIALENQEKLRQQLYVDLQDINLNRPIQFDEQPAVSLDVAITRPHMPIYEGPILEVTPENRIRFRPTALGLVYVKNEDEKQSLNDIKIPADFFESIISEIKSDKEFIDYTQASVKNIFITEQDITKVNIDSPTLPQEIFPEGTIPIENIFSTEQAEKAVKAFLEVIERKLSVASIKVIGNPLIQKGQKNTVTISNLGIMGELDSGEYFVEKVSHEINLTDGFITEFDMRRPFAYTNESIGQTRI